ncbi:hypothetical protein [Nocardiopsis sp. CNT312]|uniref:hypothetical protein n=1 Tax=Nocardiopsis sp. CNT312 TaxID=1137268 RepID=UPI0004B2440B|nr:hypothetical protein [Nocardiopsis sp. CNT312]
MRAEAARGGPPSGTDVEAFAELLSGAGHDQFPVRPGDGLGLDRIHRAVRLVRSAAS